MTLYPCPECEREISDQAASCPQCGHPVRPPTASPSPATPEPVPEGKSSSPVGWGFGVVVGGCLALVAIPLFLIFGAGLCTTALYEDTASKGAAAAAKTDLRNAMTAQEAYYSEHEAYATNAWHLDIQLSSGVLTVLQTDEDSYVMRVQSRDDQYFCVNSESGEIVNEETC